MDEHIPRFIAHPNAPLDLKSLVREITEQVVAEAKGTPPEDVGNTLNRVLQEINHSAGRIRIIAQNANMELPSTTQVHLNTIESMALFGMKILSELSFSADSEKL